jgi:predicted nucleic acid-binding protein
VAGIERFANRVLGLDTAPLIYLIEDHPIFANPMARFFDTARASRVRIVTSVVTLAEVLVKPLREGQTALAERYRNILLNSAELITLPVTSEIAGQAARLRAAYSFRTPDAIQVATALTAGAAGFLTNDAALRKVAELEVLTLVDL